MGGETNKVHWPCLDLVGCSKYASLLCAVPILIPTERPLSFSSLAVPIPATSLRQSAVRQLSDTVTSPSLHLPVPHALVVQNPRSQTVILEPSDPAVVRHTKLAKHAATLPDDDRGVEIFGRRRDEDLFRVLGQGLADLRLEVRAEIGRFGGTADDHDAAEQVAAAAVVCAGGDFDRGDDGAVEGHDWGGAIEGVGVDERWGRVVVDGAGSVRGVVVGLGSADVFRRW